MQQMPCASLPIPRSNKVSIRRSEKHAKASNTWKSACESYKCEEQVRVPMDNLGEVDKGVLRHLRTEGCLPNSDTCNNG